MLDARLRYGEILYFFVHKVHDTVHALAVVSLYSLEDARLLAESLGAVWACRAQGDHSLIVIDVKTILTCVAMVPHSFPIREANLEDNIQLYLAMDKIGTEIGNMEGTGNDDDNDEENDNDIEED